MLTRHAQTDEGRADARLAALLDAASAPAEPGPAPGEEPALAAFRASCVRTDGWRSRMHVKAPLKSLGVTAASAGLLLTGGFAAAAAGALPGAAQDTASDMLASLEIEVPGANEHSAGHADTRGKSTEAPPASTVTDAPDGMPDAATFGQTIAELAKNTALTGAEKGKAISEAAKANGEAHRGGPGEAPEQSSAGRDHAQGPAVEGQAHSAQGQAPATQGGQSADHAPPVATPNEGGTTTADDATTSKDDGASDHGTGTAGEKSGGRSTAGSANAP